MKDKISLVLQLKTRLWGIPRRQFWTFSGSWTLLKSNEDLLPRNVQLYTFCIHFQGTYEPQPKNSSCGCTGNTNAIALQTWQLPHSSEYLWGSMSNSSLSPCKQYSIQPLMFPGVALENIAIAHPTSLDKLLNLWIISSWKIIKK